MAEGINVGVVEYIDNRPVLVIQNLLFKLVFYKVKTFSVLKGHVFGQTVGSIGSFR